MIAVNKILKLDKDLEYTAVRPKDGVFEFDNQQRKKDGFDDNKPVYILFFNDKSGTRQRAIMQF